ncbi:sensor histidine kinase [Sphingosinicella microcystinivorans]|uniref:sensor histidine kinase n=1 Tax=Sphingosinicella microcystinivorans TaxID=335406 RepID=UPI0022F393B1|nr:HAMP domain-containing sensor histidine kinase [Sphingosinicella microcystinivorans]WBX83148.1 HAMP domain-containing sensor histidine kinase [Sphingosinicella microcystinivorans]
MRHDDTIRTAVALAERDSPDARAAAFRQLIDLSLQGKDCADARLRRRALRALSRLSRDVPESLRNAMIDKAARAGARSLHLRLFRGSVSHHYDRMLQVARLDEPEWWRLARRAPRHLYAGMLSRRDLPGPVRELLSGGGAGPAAGGGADRLFVPDAALAAKPAEVVDKARFAPAMPSAALDAPAAPALESGRSQIRELLDRISAFRSRGHEPEHGEAAGEAAPEPRESPTVEELERRWTWRCDEQGVLIESPATPPQLVGHWLVEFDSPDGSGQVRRAAERRVPFRDVIVTCQPELELPGRWRMSGLPQFDRKTGRFTGYWGSAIALDPPERIAAAASQAAGLFGTGASSEAFATMAHEVRTPLNAIIGFAQLIEGEILGEAGAAYKAQAGDILKQAEKLLSAFDDLSDAARIEQGRYRPGLGTFDAAAKAREVIARYEGLAGDRGVALVPFVADAIPPVASDSSVFERALARLLTAAVACAAADEAVLVIVQGEGGALRVAVSRPRATLGKSEDELFDPAGIPGGEDAAPILGVGFGLKLVGSLAATVGGTFRLAPHVFELSIPLGHPPQRQDDPQEDASEAS